MSNVRVWCFYNLDLNFDYTEYMATFDVLYVCRDRQVCPEFVQSGPDRLYDVGYVYFKYPRWSHVANELGGKCHVEPFNGTLSQYEKYCYTRGLLYEEWGTHSAKQMAWHSIGRSERNNSLALAVATHSKLGAVEITRPPMWRTWLSSELRGHVLGWLDAADIARVAATSLGLHTAMLRGRVRRSPPSFVNQGTSGCTFRPAVNCPGFGDSTTAKISKVFKSKDAMEEEYVYTTKMVEIDPERKFTLAFFGKCVLQAGDFGSAISSCNFGSNTEHERHQMVFEDGGDDLHVAVTKIEFKQIFKALYSVFEGVEIMVNKQFIHLDIKPSNMVYTSNEGKVALIDFGIAATFDEFRYNHIACCSSAYSIYPTEFPTLANTARGLRGFTPKLDHMQNSNLLHAFVSPLFQRILNHAGRYSSNLLDEINKCNQLFLSHNTDATPVLEYIPVKVDVYSLGASIMMMLERSHEHKMAMIEGADEEFYIEVMRLCRKMLHVSPKHRVTAARASTIFKRIVLQYSR